MKEFAIQSDPDFMPDHDIEAENDEDGIVITATLSTPLSDGDLITSPADQNQFFLPLIIKSTSGATSLPDSK